MTVDFTGALVVCKSDTIELCKPRDLCDWCGLDCSLEKLLPYGMAWVINKQKPIAAPLAICEPITDCEPCKPSFFERWFKFRTRHVQEVLSKTLNTLQDMNPLTSKTPSFWLKKYGIDKACGSAIECEPKDCGFCETTNCFLSDESQRAADYNLLRFYLRITRNDFAQNLVQWNNALQFLGLSLMIDNEIPCDNPRIGYTYEHNDNVSAKKFIEPCMTVQDGYTYSESTCPPIEVLRLKLVRNTDLLMPAPIGLCSIDPCNKDGGLLMCAPVGHTPKIKVTAVIKGCGDNDIYDPLKTLAVCLIKKYWLVSQPMELR
jgi:hypothetical protein